MIRAWIAARLARDFEDWEIGPFGDGFDETYSGFRRGFEIAAN